MDSRREVLAGTIFVKRKHSWLLKKRYAVAFTGRDGIGVETSRCEDRQAHLLIYKVKSNNSDIIERINFSTVLAVSAGPSGITLRLSDSLSDFKFCTKRSSENKWWMEVCTLLNAFPHYSIPLPPGAQSSLLRPELATLSAHYREMYNAYEAWTVHVLVGSVSQAWDIVGLRIVTIGRENRMLNVIHPTTKVTKLKVARHDILRCGFWDSMICLEVSVGLRGVLWMDCFPDQVKEMRDKIHNFAFYGLEAKLSPSPRFSSFFSDLPFSPRCYFDRPPRSRSTSLSSQSSSSDRSDTLSCSLQLEWPVAHQDTVTSHSSSMPINFNSHSNNYLCLSPVDQRAQKPDLVHRQKKCRSILLQPGDLSSSVLKPQDYTEPIITKPCLAASSLADYIVMQPCNQATTS